MRAAYWAIHETLYWPNTSLSMTSQLYLYWWNERKKSRQSDSTNYTRVSGRDSTPCWRNWHWAGAVSSVPTASVADTLPLSSLTFLRISVPLCKQRVKRIEWVFYLLKLSLFSPLVRHVSRCLLIKCCGTLTEHTGHSTAKDTQKNSLFKCRTPRQSLLYQIYAFAAAHEWWRHVSDM